MAAARKDRALAFYFFGAHGKRRGFCPAAAARHWQSARVYTKNPPKNLFFWNRFEPALCREKNRVELSPIFQRVEPAEPDFEKQLCKVF